MAASHPLRHGLTFTVQAIRGHLARIVLAVAICVGCTDELTARQTAAAGTMSPGKGAPVIEMSHRCDARTCPDYRLQIYPDGRVTYHGREIVNTVGEKTSAIPPAELAELIRKFRAANFFDRLDNYPPTAGVAANWSRVELTFRDMGKEHSVKFTHDYVPDGFRGLVAEVNKVTNAKQWICPFRRHAGAELVCPYD